MTTLPPDALSPGEVVACPPRVGHLVLLAGKVVQGEPSTPLTASACPRGDCASGPCSGCVTAGQKVHRLGHRLRQPTITVVADRGEPAGLLVHDRDAVDRHRVWLPPTAAGEQH